MSHDCACKKQHQPSSCRCHDKPCKPELEHCSTCNKPLYEINTYHDICLYDFSVVINNNKRGIEGFWLAFVDQCGHPVCFDDYETFMSIEVLDCCNSKLISCNDKTYYTYTEQANNCLPINPALWTYRYPTNARLRLSFRLCHRYTYPISLFVNVFYRQYKCPRPVLEPVINNAIQSDLYNHCVKDPYYPGYVTWMSCLRENCPCKEPDGESNDYPITHT